jgi:hypothetical protein
MAGALTNGSIVVLEGGASGGQVWLIGSRRAHGLWLLEKERCPPACRNVPRP